MCHHSPLSPFSPLFPIPNHVLHINSALRFVGASDKTSTPGSVFDRRTTTSCQQFVKPDVPSLSHGISPHCHSKIQSFSIAQSLESFKLVKGVRWRFLPFLSTPRGCLWSTVKALSRIGYRIYHTILYSVNAIFVLLTLPCGIQHRTICIS